MKALFGYSILSMTSGLFEILIRKIRSLYISTVGQIFTVESSYKQGIYARDKKTSLHIVN